MLTWDYSDRELTCYDASFNSAITLRKDDEEAGIVFTSGNLRFAVDPDDIDHIYFQEPKFFKKGAIAFFDDDGEILKYVCEGREIPLFIEVPRKQKNAFYLMYGVFNDNGFELIVS